MSKSLSLSTDFTVYFFAPSIPLCPNSLVSESTMLKPNLLPQQFNANQQQIYYDFIDLTATQCKQKSAVPRVEGITLKRFTKSLFYSYQLFSQWVNNFREKFLAHFLMRY